MMAEQPTRASSKAVLVRYTKTRISVVEGADAGSSIETASKAVRIGTSPENDLVLTDDTVSRRHCAIEPIEGGFRVRDEGSKNGVLFSDTRLFDAVLHGPARLSLGQTLILVEPLSETVDREQST